MKRRRGLGTVIATLIILVGSVVLAAGLVFFGGSLFQGNAELEAIHLSNAHIWVSPNGTSSVAAMVIQNTGDKGLLIDRILIRGLSVPVSDWYYNSDAGLATALNMQRDLPYDGTLGNVNIDGVAGEEGFARASGPLSLDQGQVIFVYLANPAGITAIDSGFGYTMNVEADRASAVLSSVHVGSG